MGADPKPLSERSIRRRDDLFPRAAHFPNELAPLSTIPPEPDPPFILLRALRDLLTDYEQETIDDLDAVSIASRLAMSDLLPIIETGIARGYMNEGEYGELRLTAKGCGAAVTCNGRAKTCKSCPFDTSPIRPFRRVLSSVQALKWP
jgi:hypothetical protein